MSRSHASPPAFRFSIKLLTTLFKEREKKGEAGGQDARRRCEGFITGRVRRRSATGPRQSFVDHTFIQTTLIVSIQHRGTLDRQQPADRLPKNARQSTVELKATFFDSQFTNNYNKFDGGGSHLPGTWYAAVSKALLADTFTSLCQFHLLSDQRPSSRCTAGILPSPTTRRRLCALEMYVWCQHHK